VVYHSPGDIGIDGVSEPKVSCRSVGVKFKAGSICGTALHFYHGEWQIRLGTIIGHDGWGVRDDTGERVIMVPVAYCVDTLHG
jgi:threonine dehydrogenase-like Zn-dependent dehydrogenase